MDLSIIIINYRAEKYIDRCLRSIFFKGTKEIIIIDNEGNPKLMDRVSSYPDVKIIPFAGNLGFAGGNNKALEIAQGEFVCLLNADAFPDPRYFDEAVNFHRAHAAYSSVQGKLIFENNRDLIDSTGNAMTKVRYAFNRDQFKRVDAIQTPSSDVFGVTAAACVYRKACLEEVKLGDECFDQDFFAYLEDVDLDWRLLMLGYRAYFLNSITAFHVRNASTGKSYRVRQALRNRLYLIIKNDAWFSVLANLTVMVPILLLFPNRLKNYGLILKMFTKRAAIQKKRAVRHREIAKYFVSLPWKKLTFKRNF